MRVNVPHPFELAQELSEGDTISVNDIEPTATVTETRDFPGMLELDGEKYDQIGVFADIEDYPEEGLTSNFEMIINPKEAENMSSNVNSKCVLVYPYGRGYGGENKEYELSELEVV